MAHEIEKSDRLFTVRQPSWHGLEELLPDYPTRDEAEKLVHNWDVIREPLYRKSIGISAKYPDDVYETYELVPEFELNVRSDNGDDLAVVPTDRVDVQPREVWDMAELIQGEDKSVLFETAGSLRGGRDIWILVRLNEPVVVQGDPNGESLPYLALQNSYAPGTAFRAQASNVRIVCANTSRASDVLADAQGVNFSFAHTTNLADRLAGIRDALAGWRTSIQSWHLAKEHMATVRVNTEQMNWFIEQFIPMPNEKLISDRVRSNIETSRIELITELYGGMNQGITGTALGLFEAASSWNEHIRAAANQQSRFRRAMLEPTTILEEARDLALVASRV